MLCPVLDDRNGRPVTQVLDHVITNGSGSCEFRSIAVTRSCHAGPPLQGECRWFDPVSTHHLNKWAYEAQNGPRVCRNATACSGFTFGFA